MTAFDLLLRVSGTKNDLRRLYGKLKRLSGMVSVSAPPMDREKVSSSGKSPDKIGDYVSAADEIQTEINQLKRLRLYALRVISRDLTGEIKRVMAWYYVGGYSTRTIADKLGLSQSTISRYKRQGDALLQAITIL